mmetsp:Transcript_7844/g.15289  ORF Transcript_7844/g.15289 Transcript_7844/m.15289 type:complete len:99 (+) Transcript_7844:115-411(+)
MTTQVDSCTLGLPQKSRRPSLVVRYYTHLNDESRETIGKKWEECDSLAGSKTMTVCFLVVKSRMGMSMGRDSVIEKRRWEGHSRLAMLSAHLLVCLSD